MTLIKQITPECQPVFPCWLWSRIESSWKRFSYEPMFKRSPAYGDYYTHFAPDQPTPPTEVPEAGPNLPADREWVKRAAREIDFCVTGGLVAPDWSERYTKWEKIILRHAPSLVSSAAPQATGGTPETDAIEFDPKHAGCVPAFFGGLEEGCRLARQLEIQRDEARRDADESAASASQWMQTAQRRADDLATLRAELAEARDIIKYNGERMKAMEDVIETLRAENEQLRQWKESALAVEREWDSQTIAKMLGAKLGESCRKVIGEKVPVLIADLEKAKADVEHWQRARQSAIDGGMLLKRDLAAANAQLAEKDEHLRDFIRDVSVIAFGEWSAGKNEDDILKQLALARERMDWLTNAGLSAEEYADLIQCFRWAGKNYADVNAAIDTARGNGGAT